MARIVKPKPPKPPSPPPPPPVSPPPPVVTPVVTGDSPYRALGNTTREAFKAAMSRSVTHDPPPFVGELDGMFDALAAGGVTRLGPPMSWMECKNSTYPTCGVPRSAHNPWSVTGKGNAGSAGRWAVYTSYTAAAMHWAELVTHGTPYKQATSIRDFVNVYAPSFENDVNAYVNVIVEGVNALPLAGSVPVEHDVLELLFGGEPFAISAYYGQLVTWSCPGCYDYFTAYGLDSAHHWAYDVSAAAGEGAPLYAPFAGTVVCAGTGVGQGAWGTGCAAFGRDNNYGGLPAGAGAGRLELLHARGDRSLILGHVLGTRAHAGDRVRAGDLVGWQGGMNASHVHAEGRYANGTRIGDPRVLFGGGAAPGPQRPGRVAIPQPDAFAPNEGYLVEVIEDGVPVLQRAAPDAPVVADPYTMGETFRAPYLVYGDGGEPYWIGPNRGRVPYKGTRSPDLLRRMGIG